MIYINDKWAICKVMYRFISCGQFYIIGLSVAKGMDLLLVSGIQSLKKNFHLKEKLQKMLNNERCPTREFLCVLLLHTLTIVVESELRKAEFVTKYYCSTK